MSQKHAEEVEEEEVAPFWMISFSDLMTLLLAFFIILFSLSTIEEKKMAELVEAMGGRYLRGSSVRGGAGGNRPTQMQQSEEPQTQQPEEQPMIYQGDKPPVAIPPPVPKKRSGIDHLIIPFALENTELNDADKKDLAKLAGQLRGVPTPIIVKGHASNNEKSRSVVDDIAYERAWNVREYLMTLGLERKRFSLIIVGPNEPLDKNPVLFARHLGDVNTYAEVILDSE